MPSTSSSGNSQSTPLEKAQEDHIEEDDTNNDASMEEVNGKPSCIKTLKSRETIVTNAIINVLGNPVQVKKGGKNECNSEFKKSVYEKEEVDWQFWTNEIKDALLTSLFQEFSLNENEKEEEKRIDYPGHLEVRALRERLHCIFPKVFGYAVIYKKSEHIDAYQMHKKRCPVPKAFQDCTYWSLIQRLGVKIEKQKRRDGNSDKSNSARRRKAEQVCF